MQAQIVDSVIAADGSRIGYRTFGSGPALVLLHGGLQASQNFVRLAELLSDAFTVHVPDRRGRGMSLPCNAIGLQREVEDVAALLSKTGARRVFGLSSGAILALQAAATSPAIEKLAVYEPPLPLESYRATFDEMARGYEEAMRRNDLARAMLIVLKGTGDTTLFRLVPHAVFRPLFGYLLNAQAKRVKDGDASIASLIKAMRNDLQIVKDIEAAPLQPFSTIRADTLLLGGSKSPQFLKAALDALAGVLPRAARIELAKADHIAADNVGKPELVARELRTFFG
ncbi:alpha/beta hydrolase [Bradyrhizobium tropiciagri]|uniref:alpha/beta fold hydrolase n=1 Tax=Bradyrhizobium tropiciagri TaxID=312253 RepID=UPI001BA534A4|nr:alpha/beta hydrolase [Bradyrhizobium tropiciagri]MBR0870137.1 alpha/beta hydrolase [Bradyrhizobium tropiciagri]